MREEPCECFAIKICENKTLIRNRRTKKINKHVIRSDHSNIFLVWYSCLNVVFFLSYCETREKKLMNQKKNGKETKCMWIPEHELANDRAESLKIV